MDIRRLTEVQRIAIRKNCLRSLFCYCQTVMGFDDITESLHGEYCYFLEREDNRKQATMPRSYVKTWIGTIAYPSWITLPRVEEDEFPIGINPKDKFYNLGPNMRILIESYIVSNAEKMIGLIRKTYESNVAMQILFPEVIPENFKKTKWSNNSSCLPRTVEATESTFEAAGIGGGATSRHYDLIIEDDLIYANKDDFSGQELQPNQEDIDNAIGCHRMANSLLVPGSHTHIHNQGTRWGKKDLVQYIWDNEPEYKIFRKACVEMPDEVISGKDTDTIIDWESLKPTWNEMYDLKQLKTIAAAQGKYMFATQYLLLPSSPEELLFRPSWLQFYDHITETPKTMRIFTTVDLSEWDVTKNSANCNGVVLTCGWCDRHHMWILGYDYGRFSPTETLFLMAKHWKLYSPEAIYPESIYYQKALAHFAREYMNMTPPKLPQMTIRELLPEGNKSKVLRIMSLEPLASNLAIHCRKDMKEWISEYTDYSPKNRLCTKDLLDAAAYQVQIARPGVPLPVNRVRDMVLSETVVCNTDDLLRTLWSVKSNKDIFGNETVRCDPFNEIEDTFEGTVDELINQIKNPFEL